MIKNSFLDLFNDNNLTPANKYWLLVLNEIATNGEIEAIGDNKDSYKGLYSAIKVLTNNTELNNQVIHKHLNKLQTNNYINIHLNEHLCISICLDKCLNKQLTNEKVEKTPQKAVKTKENRVEGFSSAATVDDKKKGPTIINPVSKADEHTLGTFWDDV